ncbi:alpha/beta fold hydrolase [Salinarimonas ramus]|uniref:Hydrolase n=1 Tax=Salinarimonas ramus TaxID=690164 RepID=A0A917QAH4_9HYPH|nr:alpha/beta fold hydrolase [Salinarimonas ramus]GGK36534.1 hydrolase [Salinarimonas ramus]
MLRYDRSGEGPAIVLVHGLGGTRRSFDPILPGLRAQRTVITLDLPAHGETPGEPDSGSFAGLARSLDAFLRDEGLERAALVGASLGARLVLEMARRGLGGPIVALDPGGFWEGRERTWFRWTLTASLGALRGLGPLRGPLARNAATRSLLLAQLSARPARVPATLAAREIDGLARTPTVGALIRDLADGPRQEGPAAAPSGPVVIGWGRKDRLCLPAQAARACAAFPSAHLHWFDECGHFPVWDAPDATLALVLATTQPAGEGAG